MLDKTAIVTLYGNFNIGNKLQNYAVQELCKKFSRDVITLAYDNYWEPVDWKGKIAASIGIPSNMAHIARLQLKRMNRFKDFSNKWLVTSDPFEIKNFDKTFNERYDAFVVGSDQVWHNWKGSNKELSYFFLESIEYRKRICLAPSFGFDSVNEIFKDSYIKGLSGFEFLSCREKTGCQIIRRLTGKKSSLLLDPTMMLDPSEWKIVEKEVEYDLPKKFILVYPLGDITERGRLFIKEISKKNDWTIIDITDSNNQDYYLTTPDEFLYLMRRASFVATNSFHGTVFSILYNKNFAVLPRSDADGVEMGDRLKTLLTTFDLENRVCLSESEGIDYLNVNRILSMKRAEELEYLQKSFAFVDASRKEN